MAVQPETYAVDLLEHPGWKELLHDITRESLEARRIIFHGKGDTAEQQGLEGARARGVLGSLRLVVKNLYERANMEMPNDLKYLFE